MSTRVLVADDSSFMRTIIVDVLHELGVTEITQVADGREAAQAFRQGNIDLVILDWEMPHMSGVGVTKAIRETGADIPIVMVTGVGMKKEHVVTAVHAGATDYLLKPFEPSTLRKKLLKYCTIDTPDAVPA